MNKIENVLKIIERQVTLLKSKEQFTKEELEKLQISMQFSYDYITLLDKALDEEIVNRKQLAIEYSRLLIEHKKLAL